MTLSKKITGIALALVTASTLCAATVATKLYSNVFALNRDAQAYTCASVHFDMNDSTRQGDINLSTGSTTAIAIGTHQGSVGTVDAVTMTSYEVRNQQVYMPEGKGMRFSTGSNNSTLVLNFEQYILGCDVYAIGWKGDSAKLNVNGVTQNIDSDDNITGTSGELTVTYNKYHYDFSASQSLTLAATKRLFIGDIALRYTNEAPQIPTHEVSISEALEIIEGLESGVPTTDLYTLTNVYVKEVTTAYNSSYSNISFDISTDENSTDTIRIYRAITTEAIAARIKKGAYVTITGNLEKYISNNNTLYELVNAESVTIVQDAPTPIVAEVTMTAGTNGSACTVNDNNGIKIGTSSKGGTMTISVPANVTKVTLYAAAWNNVTGLSLNISGGTCSPSSIALTADSGIAGNSPFTLNGSEEDYKFELDVIGGTTYTLTTSAAKRCVVWGATGSN